tara:strand:+ start:186 stop:512 length:327 start_codon:yes stop_codon:yes gene_type:complete
MGLNKFVRRSESKLRPAARIVNKIVDRAPAVLGKTSKVLDKVGNISGKVLENPLTAAFVAANPELLPAYGAAIGASELISKAGTATGKASNSLEKAQPAVKSVTGKFV